jgi:FkbM family methyltransferase
MRKKMMTALNVFKAQGPGEVMRLSFEKAAMWWHHGDLIELSKLVGRPTPIARIDPCRFRLDAPTVSSSVRDLLLSGQHEKAERTLMRQFMNPDLPLIELGGAFGVVSCIANKRLSSPRRHVVVEANPNLIPVLNDNRDRNGCQFTVLQRVVGYGHRSLPFHVDANVLASNSLVATGEAVEVATTTLAEIIETYGFRPCTVIADIEGAEADLVRHEADTIARYVETLIVEVHDRLIGPAAAKEFLRTLDDMGCRLVGRVGDSMAFHNTRLGQETRRAPSVLEAPSVVK